MLDKILIKCPTEELAKEVKKVLSTLGINWWCGGNMTNTFWGEYKENTVYYINKNCLSYADLNYFTVTPEYHNHIWYTAEEFINKYKKNKTMAKEDLKSGMLIDVLINIKGGITERTYLIIMRDDELIAVSKDGNFFGIKHLDSTLKNGILSIQRIYGFAYYYEKTASFNKEIRDLLWERKEPKEYTMQEIADKLGIQVEELRIKK